MKVADVAVTFVVVKLVGGLHELRLLLVKPDDVEYKDGVVQFVRTCHSYVPGVSPPAVYELVLTVTVVQAVSTLLMVSLVF